MLLALGNARDVVFGNGEFNVHRIDLGQDHQTRCAARRYVVAHINLAQTDTPVRGRGDAGVGEIQFGVIHRRLISHDLTFVLLNHSRLGVDLLTGDGVLGQQRLIALQVELGVREKRLIVGQGALRLLQGHAVRAWIDLGQQLALSDHLAFLEVHGHQIAGDTRGDSRCHRGCHSAQCVHGDRYLADDRLGRAYRDWLTASAAESAACGSGRLVAAVEPGEAEGDQKRHAKNHDDAHRCRHGSRLFLRQARPTRQVGLIRHSRSLLAEQAKRLIGRPGNGPFGEWA